MTPRLWFDAQEDFRRQLVAHHLAVTGGNVSATARLLGMQRTYLWRLMHRLGLKGAGTLGHGPVRWEQRR